MKRTLVLIGILAAAALPRAQNSQEKAVQAYVEDWLLRLGDHRFDTLDADFAAKSLVVTVREQNGKWTTTYQPGDAWLAGLKKNPNPVNFREPITNVKVTIDSDALAYLRADFKVVRDGKEMSSGVDQFTLVKEDGRWKIATIAYTSQPAK